MGRNRRVCLSPAAPAAATWTPPYCTGVAADMSEFSYLSCPRRERAHPDRVGGVSCGACGSGGPATARVYRLLLSVATHDRVYPVVLFVYPVSPSGLALTLRQDSSRNRTLYPKC